MVLESAKTGPQNAPDSRQSMPSVVKFRTNWRGKSDASGRAYCPNEAAREGFVIHERAALKELLKRGVTLLEAKA